MRELTVRVSDSQFDILVNFLRTLPYVQLPSSLKKKENPEQIIEKDLFADNLISKKTPSTLIALGEIDNTPFDIDDIKINHSIKWDKFQEVIELFKNVPLENCIEQHTELHTD